MKEELIPTGWQIVSIGEVTLPIEKIDPSRNPNQEIDYLDISGIDNKSNRILEAKHYLGKDAPSRARQLIKRDDILFSTVRTYLKNIAMVPIEYDEQVASTGFSVLRAAEGINSKLLFYYTLTQRFLNPLTELQRGSSYPAVRDDDVRIQIIPIAPYNEQKRIVAKVEELFSELDKGIENLKTALEQLKVYRQAILKHAFEGKLTAHWRENNLDTITLKNFVSGNEVKDFPELPKGWIYTRLGEVIDDPKYGTSKKCDYDINGVGVLRIPNIVSGVVDSTDLKFADFDGDEINTYGLIRGDILIIRSNGSVSIVGKCAMVREQDEKFLYAGYLIRLRPNKEFVFPEFLLHVLSSHLLRIQIEHKAKSTSGVNNINSGELQSLIIPICGTKEQEEVIKLLKEKLSIIGHLEDTIEGELQRSEAMRQSILKKAFSGKLVAQDPNDEPASVLLERIRAEKEAQPHKKIPKQKQGAEEYIQASLSLESHNFNLDGQEDNSQLQEETV